MSPAIFGLIAATTGIITGALIGLAVVPILLDLGDDITDIA